jgi:hypothetical protein
MRTTRLGGLVKPLTATASRISERRQSNYLLRWAWKPLAAVLMLLTAVSIAPHATRAAVAQYDEKSTNVSDGRAPPILAFSENPTDEEFQRTGLFVQPIIPVGRTIGPENQDLSEALIAYDAAKRHDGPDAVEPILTFLANHPNSAWTPALLLDLGAIYRQTGHFSKALEVWQTTWRSTKDLADPKGRAIGDAAIAYLSQFEAYLGRKESL